MTNEEFKKLSERSKSFAIKRGFSDQEAEDFAQECCIKAFEIGAVKIEYVFLNYRDRERANKRILGSLEGQLSAPRTISFDAPADSSNPDSSKFSELIGVSGADVDSRGELISISEILGDILGLIKCDLARKEVEMIYSSWIEENI